MHIHVTINIYPGSCEHGGSQLHTHNRHQRSSSAGSNTNTTISSISLSQAGASQGSIDDISLNSHRIRSPQNLSLSFLLESVLCAIEEPRGLYQ